MVDEADLASLHVESGHRLQINQMGQDTVGENKRGELLVEYNISAENQRIRQIKEKHAKWKAHHE